MNAQAIAVQAPPCSLSKLLGPLPAGVEDVHVSGLAIDSRRVHPGDLFFALPGDQHDGRQFIEQAVAAGAAAIVAEPPVAGFLDVDAIHVPLIERAELQEDVGPIAARFFGEPSQHMHVTGITGTNGKTTVSQLIAQLIRQQGRDCGAIGTLGALLGDRPAEASHTTPDPLSLQRCLAGWRSAGVAHVTMEVSSHALVQHRVAGIGFDTAIFTNLSHDHLDYHGSMDAYGRAKQQLFLLPGLTGAVINVDDPFAATLLRELPEGVQALTTSAGGQAADVTVSAVEFTTDGIHGHLHSPWGESDFHTPLIGAFNVDNLLLAVAGAVLAGMPFERVVAGLASVKPVPGRMERVPGREELLVIVDYAHTPDALEKALAATRLHTPRRLIAVFGCGGDRDREKRPAMGRLASMGSDHLILTSDNPRTEDPMEILEDIAAGCTGSFEVMPDRREAIRRAISEARPGDAVLIAGKGHEDYQIIGTEKLPFSDVAEASAVLAEWRP